VCGMCRRGHLRVHELDDDDPQVRDELAFARLLSEPVEEEDE
jgi:hypothetical protein